jgi:hypothetical protein
MRGWNLRLVEWAARFPSTIDRACVAGLHADRVGYAFAAGYQCALHAIDPSMHVERIASFCATEAGGAHPRAIQTKLVPADGGFHVSGTKRWSTMAPDADVLLVVASRGVRADGTNDLAVVRVDARAKGVAIAPMPMTQFIPEIVHAEIRFDDAHIASSDVLPGDGYARYVKAFRTVEDIHVHAALLGHLVRIARVYDWPRESVERALAIIVVLRSLVAHDPNSSAVHLALAGVLNATRDWIAVNHEHWDKVDEEVRTRWHRDLPLLQVADTARTQRTERAWLRMQGSPEDYQ